MALAAPIKATNWIINSKNSPWWCSAWLLQHLLSSKHWNIHLRVFLGCFHEGNWREIQYLAASRREVLRCSAGDGWEEVARLFGLVVGLCEDNRELVGGVDDTTPSFTVSSRVNWHTQMVKMIQSKAKHQWAVQKANTQNSHKRQKGRNKVFFHISSIQKTFQHQTGWIPTVEQVWAWGILRNHSYAVYPSWLGQF